MTSELDKRVFRFLSFSRRMESLGLMATDLPKLPPECVGNLLEVIDGGFRHASEEGTEKFWRKFAEKCDDADINEKFLGGFRHENFLRGELGYIMQNKRMESIDALEFMFRTPGMPEHLSEKIKKALEESEYFLDDSKNPVCIQWSALMENDPIFQKQQ